VRPAHAGRVPAPEAAGPVRALPVRGRLQRCGGVQCPPGTCDHSDDDEQVKRSVDVGTAVSGGTMVPASVHRTLARPGSALDVGTRMAMQARFGHDFSQVRVHTDAEAAQSAAAVQAQAYTFGRHVVMGAGRYQPHTPAGRRLLAHELTHVIQQADTSGDTSPTGVGEPNTQAEHEAGKRSDDPSSSGAEESARVTSESAPGTIRPLRDQLAATIGSAVASPGQPLDERSRHEFGPLLGYNFGRVQVHTDARSAQAATSLDADAFSVGAHLVFGAGRYAPQTEIGRDLIAHELTHVAQQGPSAPASGGLALGTADDAEEAAAREPVSVHAMTSGVAERATSSTSVLTVRRSPAGAAPTRAHVPRAPVVPDGKLLTSGQMHQSDFLNRLEAQLLAACDEEFAAFGRSAKNCPTIVKTIERHRRLPVSALLRLIQFFASPAPGASAAELIAATTRQTRTVARKVAQRSLGGDTRLQSAAQPGVAPRSDADADLARTQLGSGRPLDASTRGAMEGAFNTSFADIRVHSDESAAQLTAGLRARAFTVGTDIAFGANQYQPGTADGLRLVAHELSHAVQQRNAVPSVGSLDERARWEAEADQAAQAALTPGVNADSVLEPGRTGRQVQGAPVVLAGALIVAEATPEVVIVAEVSTVTTEVVVVDGALTAATSAAAPLVADVTAPVVLETATATTTAATTAASSSAYSTAAAVAGTGITATTLSSDSPTEESQDKRRNCMRDNPYAIPCEDEIPLEEQVIEWIMRQGYSYESLGECTGFGSHGPGTIAACAGAPGESWHCDVAPYVDPISGVSKPGGIVSVFSCLCCRADGTVGFEWRPDHWSPGAP
jgi:hypothetical protein